MQSHNLEDLLSRIKNAELMNEKKKPILIHNKSYNKYSKNA